MIDSKYSKLLSGIINSNYEISHLDKLDQFITFAKEFDALEGKCTLVAVLKNSKNIILEE